MNIVITGGGTGGHLYPGLELAKFYTNLGHKVYYIASKNGIDQEIIKAEPNLEKIEMLYWDLRGIQRKINLVNIIENTKTIGKLIYLKYYAKKFLKQKKIKFVIGVGGYISYPLVNEATKLKIYTMIHEQNSYPGLVNRKLAQVVDKIGIAYESSRQYFKNCEQKIVNVANPRVDNTKVYKNETFFEELGLNPKKKIILFLGGSLGAQTINELFTFYVNQQFENYQAVLISGLKNNEVLENINLNDNIILKNTNKLLKYVTTADIIISRAGATTLLEIIYMEKKAIIIPSPNVVANHQWLNASEFAQKDLVTVIKETELTPEYFIKEMENLQKNNKRLENLQKYSKINSLAKFKEILEEIDDLR
ncbi:MAG: UDP-N-acetylglucosamine--N-acetylmuramyl-(pentapeptide) pyrophosphoryl-undecaprenol N-acetylglucosamine transferase [Mycoplasmatales bacterium]